MVKNQNNITDLFSLMLHLKVVEKLRQTPKEVLDIAQENLNRWLENENTALLEWKKILESKSIQEIVKIISQDNDEGQRLRSSSPFAGVLSEEEREKVWSECAKIQSV